MSKQKKTYSVGPWAMMFPEYKKNFSYFLLFKHTRFTWCFVPFFKLEK